MLYYTYFFFLVAIVARVFGFSVIAGTATTLAIGLFVIFLALFIVSLLRARQPNN